MPQALSVPVRNEIVERLQRGDSLGRIALDLKLSYWSVRRIARRFRDGGPDRLRPDYDRCAHPGPRLPRPIRAAVWLKRRHRTWGAGLIRVILRRKWPDRAVPSTRTLQRAFCSAGLSPMPRHRMAQNRRRGRQPHEVWQIDAVDQAALAHGQRASWLSVVDEHTGANLWTELFPPGELGVRRAPCGARGPAAVLRPVGAAAPHPGR